MWTTLGVSVITYIPLAFVALGISLRFNSDHWRKFEIHREVVEGQTRAGISMIAYVVFSMTLSAPTRLILLPQLPCRILHTFHTYQRCPMGQWLRECPKDPTFGGNIRRRVHC
jgi:hypothetical protein